MEYRYLGELARDLRNERRRMESGRRWRKKGGMWSREWLSEEIERRYGVSVSDKTIQRFENNYTKSISETTVNAIFGILYDLPDGEWQGFIARTIASLGRGQSD